MPLHHVDDRFVPALRRGLRAVGHTLGGPLRAIARWEQRFAHGKALRALWPNRQLILLAAAVLAFAGSYVHLQRFPDLREARAGAAGSPPPEASDVPPVLAGGAVSVGPPLGARPFDYITERHEALRAADGRRIAVVSFDDYLPAEQVAAVLPEGVEVLAVQIKVPSEGEQPQHLEVAGGNVEAAVAEAVTAAAQRIAEEEAELRRLLDSGTVEDPAFAEQYRVDAERLKATRNLLQSGAPVVFAVVVDAPVEELTDLASHDAVRLVDLAPEETAVEQSTFYGLLPEDREEVTYGDLR